MFLNYHQQQQMQQFQQTPATQHLMEVEPQEEKKPKNFIMRNYRHGRNHRPPNPYLTEQYLLKQWLQGSYYTSNNSWNRNSNFSSNINMNNDNGAYFRSARYCISSFLVTKTN